MRSTNGTSAAPALERGICVLRRLAERPGIRLETLARELGAPKSSVLRLLETLAALGLARRAEAGWQALAVLTPLADDDFPARLDRALAQLAARAGRSAEWWEADDAGMVLRRRCEPPAGEVAVRAQPGFVRTWRGELDAVACLGHAALRPSRLTGGGFTSYHADGVPGPLPAAQAASRIRAAAASGQAADPARNSNGVHRQAVLLRRDGAALGVLALAGVPAPGARLPDPSLDLLLTGTATDLAR